VGIEVDGWEPHRARSIWDHDHDKANAFLEAGWRVLCVTSNSRPSEVVRQLRLFISRQAASTWRANAK
jgi:very-short-patch-repair endonuclease